MNTHECSVLQKKNVFAAEDGYCGHCRPTTVMDEVLTADEAAEITAPSFEVLLEDVGGEEAFRESVNAIRTAKLDGKRGNSLQGRLTRELLNQVIATQSAENLAKYKALVEGLGIGLNTDVDGVLFHDYSAFSPQAHGQQELPWKETVARKRAQKRAYSARKREQLSIKLSWVSSDGKETGSVILGPNNPETRKYAAQRQQAAKKKGFVARFLLVQG